MVRIIGVSLLLLSGIIIAAFSWHMEFYGIPAKIIVLTLFFTGLTLLITECMFHLYAVVRRFSVTDVFGIFKFERIRFLGLCIISFVAFPLFFVVSVTNEHTLNYAMIITFLGFTLMTIGERQLYVAISTKGVDKKRDKGHFAILKDEMFLSIVYIDIVNAYISDMKNLLDEQVLISLVNEFLDNHPAFGDLCRFEDLELKISMSDSDIISYTESFFKDITNSFSEIMEDIFYIHGQATSEKTAIETIEAIYHRVKDEYGNPALITEIVRYLPKGALEKEKLSVVDREILEEIVQQRTTELSAAFLKAKQSIEEKNVVEAIVDPLIVIGPDGQINSVNKAFEDAFGYTSNNLVGQNLMKTDFVKSMDKNEKDILHSIIIDARIDGKSDTVELSTKNRNDKIVHMSLTANTLSWDDKDFGAVLVFRDISKLKKRDKELKILDYAIERSINAIALLDVDYDIIYVNSSFFRMIGYDGSGELLYKSFMDMLSNEQSSVHNLETYFKGEGWMGEVKLKQKNGESIDALMVATTVKDDSEEPMAYMISLVDITPKKMVEQWNTFLHSLLVHDVGNKLQIVQGYQELMLEAGMDDNNKYMAKKSLESLHSASRLIEKVRMLRQAESEFGKGSINPFFILNEVLKTIEDRAKYAGIEIERNYKEKDDKVRSDSRGGTLIESIFSNILDNSIKHSDCSKISIDCRYEDDFIVFSIEDDGKGIPEDIIHESNYAKTPIDRSNTLGLRLAQGLAESLDGHIKIMESKLKGTHIDVYLRKTKTDKF